MHQPNPDSSEQELVGALRADPDAATPHPLPGAAGIPALDPGPSVLTVLSLFAGIGGLDLGLERAGLRDGRSGRDRPVLSPCARPPLAGGSPP